jgi:hypothetical protein
MDERYDLMRTARDQRYSYVRNYNPHKIYGQYIAYLWETPTTAVWDRLNQEGKLKPPQTYFWETKPAEELYDLQTDRDEVKNLAASPGHKTVLERFRKAHLEHEHAVKDIGLLPEAEIHARAKESSPYEVGHDARKYPFDRILATAGLASSMQPGVTEQLIKAMQDPDSGIRYWGVMGILIRGAGEVKKAHADLKKALDDATPSVRVAACEALGRYGSEDDLKTVMPFLLKLANSAESNSFVAIHALNAIDALGKKAAPWKAQIAALPLVDPKSPERVNREYTTRLVDRLKQTL